jgi:DNA-binding transcriptional LysR family regulator
MNEVIEHMPAMAVFVRVVDEGSFSNAARTLGQTPSAISRQIARLEAALGVRLLVRTTRKLQLSEVGASVYDACQTMLNGARAATETAAQYMGQPRGLVRLCAPMTFGKIVIAPLLPTFLAEHPDVDVQLLFTDQQLDLVADEVDLAIRIEAHPAPGMVARKLVEVRYVLCASTQYLQAAGMPNKPEDLAQHHCLYFGDGLADNQWTLIHDDVRVDVAVHGRLIVNHSEAMLEAVRAGVGIGFLPDFTARQALSRGEVIPLFPEWQLLSPYQGTAWLLTLPNRHLPPKVRVLIDHLVAHLHGRRSLNPATPAPQAAH